MDEWTDGQMDKWAGTPRVIQDFVPFGAAAQRNQKFQFYLNKAGYLNRHQLRVLGRSGNVEGRGSGGSRIHDGISRICLRRSGNEKNARKVPKMPKTQRQDQQTDRPTNQPAGSEA